MFTSLPSYTTLQQNQSQYYTPHTSSPLSSSPLRRSPSSSPESVLKDRDANIQMMNDTSPSKPPSKLNKTPPSVLGHHDTRATLVTPPMSNSRPSTTSRASVFSKRATKPNPLMGRGSGDEGRETRRKLFLKKVREESEEKRWKKRMSGEGNVVGEEELLRSLWVREERDWEDRRRREALGWDLDGLVEEEVVDSIDEVMAEEVARDEEAELEALMNQSQSFPQVLPDNDPLGTTKGIRQSEVETLYGSDDEEYDHIFMDFVESESKAVDQQLVQEYPQDQDMMDMD